MLKKLIWRGLNTIHPLFKNILSFPVFSYLVVGAANTLLNIGLFLLTFNFLQNNAGFQVPFALEIATIVSFGITVLTGFWLNKNFAFVNSDKDKKQVQKQFGKYCLVAMQGQFSDYLITKALVVLLLINGSVAYIISTVIMLVVTFLLQKYFTFKVAKAI
jgi:putative flippase GtrA